MYFHCRNDSFCVSRIIRVSTCTGFPHFTSYVQIGLPFSQAVLILLHLIFLLVQQNTQKGKKILKKLRNEHYSFVVSYCTGKVFFKRICPLL